MAFDQAGAGPTMSLGRANIITPEKVIINTIGFLNKPKIFNPAGEVK